MKYFWCALFVCSLTVLPSEADTLLIDDFSLDSLGQARRVWQAHTDTPPVRSVDNSSITFSVPFQGNIDRVYWDRSVDLDLSEYDTLHLTLECPLPAAMRSLALYFQSGDGWFIWSKPINSSGRQTVTLMKSDFETEGDPEGWHQIETIRVSPWKGADLDTTLTCYRLTATRPSIILLHDTELPPDERRIAQRSVQRMSRWLTEVNLAHAIVRTDEWVAPRLNGVRTVVLPYNPHLTSEQRTWLRTFLTEGGRVMVLYSSDEQLAAMLGFRLGSYRSSDHPGKWAAIRFVDPDAFNAPERIYQNSWNIRPAYPKDADTGVIAYWEDALGRNTGDPAWTQSPHGLWMSHILLQGDDAHKRDMLASLLAQLDSRLWFDLADYAVSRAGQFGPYTDVDDALRGIPAEAGESATRTQIESLLKKAKEQYRRMHRLFAENDYERTVALQRSLQRTLLQAYAHAQSSRPNEWRGVWDHSGTGLYPGAWERTARLLHEHGMSALFVNVLWGGLAHYESDVLPRSSTYREYGDQLHQAIEGGHAHDLEVHAWIVCWNLSGAPDDFVERMRNEDRLIISADGSEVRWLNPAHPDNVSLMVDSLKEVATRYEVDGIHLDYIRYPNRDACFSDYTRTRFEDWLGEPISQWPADALSEGRYGEAYEQFRIEQINEAVHKVYRAVRHDQPDLALSAAVWGGYPRIRRSIGQDWAAWLERGEVDFVTPMNYTTDLSRFRHLTRTQLALPHAEGRIYPGLGVTASESQLHADQVIQQIKAARELGANGWVLFDLNNTLRSDTLPALQLGVTRDSSRTDDDE